MTLENLLRIGRLKAHEPTAAEIQRLLAAIHHATMIQSLPLTLGVGNDTWVVLDALRRKRNANDYTGDIVTHDMVDECVEQARGLLSRLKQDLTVRRPELLK